jgi:acid stress-induced BolA-like protein IbaG/YrbA
VAISELFEGLSAVKRQQLIYGALTDEIASGALHAISIKAYTPAQWQATANQGA